MMQNPEQDSIGLFFPGFACGLVFGVCLAYLDGSKQSQLPIRPTPQQLLDKWAEQDDPDSSPADGGVK
jgi:hypothetical protein